MNTHGMTEEELNRDGGYEKWRAKDNAFLCGQGHAEQIEKASNGLNEFNAFCEGFAAGFLRMHPTLQQKNMRLILAVIKALAENECVDARNEAAQQLARKIDEVVGLNGVFLPYI